MLGDVHIAVGLAGATASGEEGGNAHQLVVVDSRSSSVAGTQTGEVGVLRAGREAEHIVLLQVELLVTVILAQQHAGGHL